MSLDWSTKNVAKSALTWCDGKSNKQCQLCKNEPDGTPHWRDETAHLCFLLMAVGVNSIKNEAAARSVYTRFLMLENLAPQVFNSWRRVMTPAFLLAHIGYSTNVTSETLTTFVSRYWRNLHREAERVTVSAFKGELPPNILAPVEE